MGLRDRLKKAAKTSLVRVLRPTGPVESEAPPPREWARRNPWDTGGEEELPPVGSAAAQELEARAPGSTDIGDRPLPPPAPLPTIDDLDGLETLQHMPGCLHPELRTDAANPMRLSCGYCGVGDSGHVRQPRKRRNDRGPIVRVDKRAPTPGCVKITEAAGQGRTFWPMHTQPSVLDRATGERSPITYEEAIARLTDYVLSHREPDSQVLVYGCGQIDLFTIFALQEVFRLLGVRNLGGNAEHCLNAGAVHNEMLTGQEGPFLTIEQGLEGPNRFYLLNGWNGVVTHPGVFNPLLAREDFDGYVIEVLVSESAQAVSKRLSDDRILLIRPGSDPHLAVSVAHVILRDHADAVDQAFIQRFANAASWRRYRSLAREARFAPDTVAERIAPEPWLAERIERAIADIAAKIADSDTVPINIPSVGLSQSKGAVSHCLWGSALALVGKYGLHPGGEPRGGVLRVPGQINAESEIQGLSRLFFYGRVPVDHQGMVDAARRMGLPDDAYELAERDEPRATLDYSDPSTRADRELFIAFGTQFEANLMERERWVRKLEDPDTTLVVVDPVPDPFTLAHADLLIPSPPHAAAPKLYQNGEWRLTVSVPWKQAAPETRSDATIIYDVMAEISRRIRSDSILRMIHPDLGYHSQTGYLRERFEDSSDGGGLPRVQGEVSRRHLWDRLVGYLDAGEGRKGRLYCYPTGADGDAITWDQLMDAGHLIYGGVGTTRYVVDPDDDDCRPYANLYGEPVGFDFFEPTDGDLVIPDNTILNSGRSAVSDNPKDVAFATATFNSGKATPREDMPDVNPLCVGLEKARALDIEDGGTARVTSIETGAWLDLPVRVTDRIVGNSVYMSFHKSRAQVEDGVYVNHLTHHAGRCPYTSQTNFKLTEVTVEKAPE
ncbi:MAG: hypothetical protein KDA24_13615 [Deltaproteobacteria bacterium]|nr:hypothetical protein [Deltaproteobacteria bacterium]